MNSGNRIAIRQSVYRGESGFVIAGTDSLGRRVDIFTRTRESADLIKSAVKAGRDYDVDKILLAERRPFCTFDQSNIGLGIGRWARRERS